MFISVDVNLHIKRNFRNQNIICRQLFCVKTYYKFSLFKLLMGHSISYQTLKNTKKTTKLMGGRDAFSNLTTWNIGLSGRNGGLV